MSVGHCPQFLEKPLYMIIAIYIYKWKNTSIVITLFRNIEDKHLHKFLIFDLKDFYPSIK